MLLQPFFEARTWVSDGEGIIECGGKAQRVTCTLLKGLYYTRVEGIRGEAEGAGGTLRVRSIGPRTGEEGTRDATCQIRAKLLRDGGRG